MNNNKPPPSGLEVKNVSVQVTNKLIVDSVSLRVDRGNIVGLIGPNGAGKSSLFSAIVGLTKVSSGKIFNEGRDITDLPLYRRSRDGIGYLPQDSSLFSDLTCEENLTVMLELTKVKKADRRKILDGILKEFNLTRHRHTGAGALSGGERRRTEIARAVVMKPKILLLDEPFAGIDPLAVLELERLALKLKNDGPGILITDHNVRDCLKIVDYVYVISNGRLISRGTAEEVVRDPNVKRGYLGVDFELG